MLWQRTAAVVGVAPRQPTLLPKPQSVVFGEEGSRDGRPKWMGWDLRVGSDEIVGVYVVC